MLGVSFGNIWRSGALMRASCVEEYNLRPWGEAETRMRRRTIGERRGRNLRDEANGLNSNVAGKHMPGRLYSSYAIGRAMRVCISGVKYCCALQDGRCSIAM